SRCIAGSSPPRGPEGAPMPLRIVIDARHIRDFGIGTYIRNLIHALSDLDRDNHYCLIARRDDLHDFAGLAKNFEPVVYDHKDSDKVNLIAFPLFIRSLAADLVHIPLNHVPLLLQKPYVVTIHDMSSLLFSDRSSERSSDRSGNKSGIMDNIRLYRFRRGLLRADRVIAVSEATRRDVENLLNIPSRRIRLVYSAPDPKFTDQHAPATARSAGADVWERERKRLMERYQIGYPFLLYAGRIRPHKNVPRLIEAFAVIREEFENHPVYNDLRLIIIGDEISSHPEVRRTVMQTHTENAVRFLGFVPFDTLRVFYTAAVAFVFPSLYEGFGLPPLEAMASGTPVITSNVSSLPEVVSQAAMIVNPENVFDMARGIREVLLDEDLRKKLIKEGYEQLNRFSWKNTAEQVLEVYREAASK
ncbi:MAG: glycosyltransferase family 4 protein, partial [Bryobacteraceae bacterium]